MQNVLGVWSALDLRRRIILVVTTASMIAAVLFLSKLASTPRLSLLYAGLESAAAGEVVAALDQRGVAYEVRGGSIFVDAAQRDSLRLTLASEGLPATGSVGYELLDGLSGFGTTAQMFDAAYWRAKEGELARTIMASPMIRAARVHISVPATSTFRQVAEPSASVQVTPAGAALGEEQANALRYLVASAVPGLRPEAVSVIDASTGVVLTAESQTPSLSADARRAESLRRGVERLLSARVGPGNAVVEVSLETVTDRESIVERQVDPSTRVAISSETEERSASSEGQTGAVTVASNLPDGDAGGADSSSQNSETREIVNYEVSQTEREILREPGAIRRLTVAVLVDGTRTIDPNGAEVFAARSEAELADLRDLVASAVGLDESRGDRITIKSLEFEPTAFDGSGPTSDRFGQIDVMSLIQVGILALVALALGIFVVRPILSNRALPAPDRSLPPPAGGVAAGLPAVVEAVGPALDGEIQTDDFAGPAMATVGTYGFDDGLTPLGAPGGGDGDPVSRLKRPIAERQDETIEILRSWMEDGREKT